MRRESIGVPSKWSRDEFAMDESLGKGLGRYFLVWGCESLGNGTENF